MEQDQEDPLAYLDPEDNLAQRAPEDPPDPRVREAPPVDLVSREALVSQVVTAAPDSGVHRALEGPRDNPENPDWRVHQGLVAPRDRRDLVVCRDKLEAPGSVDHPDPRDLLDPAGWMVYPEALEPWEDPDREDLQVKQLHSDWTVIQL